MFRNHETRTSIFSGIETDEETGTVRQYHAVLCRDDAGAYSLDWTWMDTGQSHHILAPAGCPDMPAWLTIFSTPPAVREVPPSPAD